ncbi:MAG: Gfo/Idh/MocA family oxidoreductase [Planctomycetes bacterium]|nr:Gfo/Idh/MocA family oxidoreductase [Planctomycetota bacterium]
MDSPKRPLTRRRFLEASAGALGAAAAFPLAVERAAHAAGSDAIRIGLIGCGDRGPGAALQALTADRGAKLVAMADVFADHIREARKQLKEKRPEQVAVDDERCFVGFDACERLIESGVDLVLIACASRFHPAYMRACIDQGKHVFVEKPHAIDPPGAHAVQEACDAAAKKGLCVVSGLHRRYDPAIRETMKRVQDGAIGDVLAAEVTFLRAPYKISERDPKWSEMEWQFKTWYHFSYLSGDDVPQSLIHTYDTAAWALGEAAPVAAHGLAGRSASIAHIYGDVFDHQTVVFEYSNGAVVYGLVRTQHGCHGEVAMKLVGTKGRAWEGGIDGATKWRYSGPNPGGHQNEQTELLAALRAGKPLNNGDYMARSTMACILGQLACTTGKKLTWKQVSESKFSYPPHDGRIDFSIEPPVKAGPDGLYPVPVPGKTDWV